MSVAEKVKGAGSIILGLSFLVGMLAIGAALLTGAAAFSLWVLKWTFPVFSIALMISVILLAPLSLIPSTRGFAAIGFTIASIVFSVILWVWGMSYTYLAWGLFGVIVGLVFLGVGVVPIAMLAALMHGDWSSLGLFIFAGLVTISLRVLSNWLAEKVDERARRASETDIIIPAYKT